MYPSPHQHPHPPRCSPLNLQQLPGTPTGTEPPRWGHGPADPPPPPSTPPASCGAGGHQLSHPVCKTGLTNLLRLPQVSARAHPSSCTSRFNFHGVTLPEPRVTRSRASGGDFPAAGGLGAVSASPTGSAGRLLAPRAGTAAGSRFSIAEPGPAPGWGGRVAGGWWGATHTCRSARAPTSLHLWELAPSPALLARTRSLGMQFN